MHTHALTEEEIEDLEVARFMAALPMEVQRLSDVAPTNFHDSYDHWHQHSYHTHELNPTYGSMAGYNVDVGCHRSNSPQSENPRKRRSLAEHDISAFDAAALVTKMYEGGYLSDEEKDLSHQVAIKLDGTSSSFHHGQMIVDRSSERPPKRFSSSSEVASFPVSPTAASLGKNTTEQQFSSNNLNMQPFPDINSSVMSAACAAVIAGEAEKRYEARLNTYLDAPMYEDVLGSQNSRKFRRRAGFSVPNSQLVEAAAMLSERMNCAEMDYAASMIQKQNWRRSSFSTFANLRNDLIGSTVPNEVERRIDCYDPLLFGQYNNPYFQNPVVPKMQRRANSLPDRNAIYVFSQKYMKERELFSDVMGTNVASNFTNAVEQQYGHPLGHLDHVSLAPVADVFAFNSPTNALQNGAAIERECTPDIFGNCSLGPFVSSSIPLTPLVPFSSTRQDVLASSIHANQVLSEIANQEKHTSDGTSRLCNLQRGQQNCVQYNICSNVQMAPRMHQQVYDEDDFNGKRSDVLSISISAALVDDHEIALLLHEACKIDDIPVIGNILQKFPLSSRWSLVENKTGEVALHIASKHGNNSSVKLLLHHDPECALIRNIEGHTALHIAVHEGYLCVVTLLCEAVPSCATKQCENGNLPLHDAVSIASKHPDTPQVIQALLHAFKNSVFVTNDEGLLPIHLAASSGFEVGLRTLLASEFSTLFTKDILDDMLPLDVAVQQLQEYLNEECNDIHCDSIVEDEYLEEDASIESNPDKVTLNICIEILLSSMAYKRLISSPRDNINGDKPFLPLHSAIDARPQLQTWKTLLAIYEDDHMEDLDPLGRNIAHRICSRPIEKIDTDLDIILDLDPNLFSRYDHFGFIPLHLAVLNKDANIEIIKEVAGRYTSSFSREVLPVYSNIYAKFLPVQIAAASGCCLEVIYLLMRAHPAAITT